jgi:hypothetical protein
MIEEAVLEALRKSDPNEALPPGDPRYYNFDSIRGSSLKERLLLLLRSSERQFLHVAVAGHRGAGKSTELNRIEESLRDQGYCVLSAAVDMVLDPNDISFSDVVRLMLLLLDERFGDRAAVGSLLREAFEAVREWFQTVTLRHELNIREAQEFGMKGALGGKTSVGFGFKTELGQLLASLNVISKSEYSGRREIREEVERYNDELIGKLNLILTTAAQDLPDEVGKGIVFLFDNSDKYRPEVIHSAFLRHADLLRAIESHLLFTVGTLVLHDPPETQVENRVEVLHLPMLPVFKTRSRTPNEPTFEALRAALRLRIPPVLLDDNNRALDLAIEKSGGCWRDLLRIVRTTLLANPGPLTERTVKAGAGEAAQSFHRLLQSEAQIERLAEVHRNWTVVADADTRYLLNQRCILAYNGEGWYDTHPLLDGHPMFLEALRRLERMNRDRG